MGDDQSEKILIIGSDPGTADYISAALKQAGYRAVTLPGISGIRAHAGDSVLAVIDINCAAGLQLHIDDLEHLPVVYIADNSSAPPCIPAGIRYYGFIAGNSGTHIITSTVMNAIQLHETSEMLRGSARDYREIFNSSGDAMFVHDAVTGAIIDVNRTMLHMYGYALRDDVLKLQVKDLSAENEGYTAERAAKMIKDAFESGNNRFEWRARRKDGEVFWVEVMLHSVTIRGVSRIIASVRDISRRKQVEEDLKRIEEGLQKERRFTQLILDTSSAYIVAVDIEGNIMMMNRAFLDFLGHTMDDVLGKNYMITVTPEEDRGQLARSFMKLMHTGGSSVDENRIRGRDGRICVVEWHGQVVSPGGDEKDFYVGAGVDITERKKAELEVMTKNEELMAMNEEMEAANEELIAVNYELQATEERYRGVVETQSEMIARFREDGTLTFANRAWRAYYSEHLGITGEVKGRKIHELMQLKNFEQVLAYLVTLNPGQMGGSMERSFVSLSGVTRWQLWYIQKIYDESRNLVEFQVVGNDITERKEAEAALRKSEERFRALVELAPDAILTGNQVGIVTGVNQRACELTGYSGEELIGMSINIIFSEQERARVPLRYDLLKEGHVIRNERILTRKDGSTIFIEMNTRMMPDGTYQTFIRDITERKEAEQAITAEKERLSVTLRSIADGVITTDIYGRVLIMNRIAEELTGWQQNEAEGKDLESVFTIIDETTRNPCDNPVKDVISTGRATELPVHTLLISRDGTEHVIADSGAPIRDRNGEIIGVVLVFRDMTEKRRLMDAVQQTDKLNSLGVLAGGIAHDFNNLLSGIFGYIEMARLKSSDNKAVTGYLDKAFTVFNRARDLTQQLLTFSKGGAPVKKTGDMGTLLRESSSFALSGSNIICEYDIAHDLKLCDFDENQMGQVIDNIIINSKQAMPLGGKIRISAANYSNQNQLHPLLGGGDYIKISITDSGIGIPPEMIRRIYDPFFTTKQQGNGLGLATAYSIIRNHDGHIEAESVPGEGTTFHIYLPVSLKSRDACFPEVQVEHSGSGRILVMDDELFIREIASELLSDMGYSVVCAADGAEAMTLCATMREAGEEFKAAFFDLTIPGGMGGRETIKEIRNLYPDMPVFASSGFSEDHVMSHPAEYGFTSSIRKPYRREELAALLNMYMREK